MKYLKILFLAMLFVQIPVNAKLLEQEISIGKYEKVAMFLDNYNDGGEPVCEFQIVAKDRELTTYMFDSCASLNITKINNSLLKIQVINYRGNRQKIIFINSELYILGILKSDLSGENVEVIDNNFNNDFYFMDVNFSDLILLEKFIP